MKTVQLPLSCDFQYISSPIRRWPVVLGGFLLNMSLGTFYAVSAFLLPIEKEFGWSRAQTSLATTLGFVMISFWFVIGGYIQDRRGPRLVAAMGTVLFSLGFFLAGKTHSLPMFYVAVGLCVGAGNGFAYVVPMAVGSKWFPDKRGLIVGLMVGGYGAGSGVFGPLASKLIAVIGWRETFRAFSIIFFLMMLLATCLVKNPPEGYQPPDGSPGSGKHPSPRNTDVPTSRMIRMPQFWTLWIGYCLGTTAGVMVISQLVPFVRASHHAPSVASFAIIVGAIGNTAGRILSGWLSDHIGRLKTLCIVLLISAVAMPVLFFGREHVVLLYLALGVVYYCYGTQLSVYASTSADFYGTRYLGLNYGILILAWGIAGVIGPMIASYVFVARGEYRWAFFAAGAISFAAFVLLFAVKPQRPSE
jgi:OFA family oxalate/formate antiporter-like MFS transporter